MRLITWNCYQGECRSRGAELSALNADIVILQECGRPPDGGSDDCRWFGDNPAKGVGVLARNGYVLEAGPMDDSISHSVFPISISGPTKFHMAAIWALPKPTYVRAIDQGLTAYGSFLRSAPSIIVGDFNSHSRWDKRNSGASHTMLVARLQSEFGLVSAYHADPKNEPEAATLYWQWKESRPYHVDYCFIPETWSSDAKASVEPFNGWEGKSDHRPLVVDLQCTA